MSTGDSHHKSGQAGSPLAPSLARALAGPCLGIAIGTTFFCSQSSAPTIGVLAEMLSRLVFALPCAGAVFFAAYVLRNVFQQRDKGSRPESDPITLPRSLCLAGGLSLLLAAVHIAGMLGVFSTRRGGLGFILAWVAVASIFWLWKHWHRIGSLMRPFGTQRFAWWTIVPGFCVGIMLAAACSPPGWLWDSEFGGYDALSYHLQLPREWLEAGRLAPLSHNVYSYLPGYLEGAYLALLSLMQFNGSDPISGDGLPLIACQLLTLLTALAAAWVTADLTRVLAQRLTTPGDRHATQTGEVLGGMLPALGKHELGAHHASALAAAVLLCTPWLVVTGSLAYNEPAMLALGAAAMLAASLPGLTPVRRGVLVAILLGAAAGVKPTALPMFGVPTLLLLLVLTPRGEWMRWLGAGMVIGIVMLLPWTIRNAMATGNPLFPLAPKLLGMGHWTSEQFTRFASAHTFDGSLLDRVRLLVLPDASDPAGVRHRGLLHPQFGVFAIGVLGAACVLLVGKARSRVGVALLAGLAAQIGLWMFATHLQSRFLMPLLVPGAACIGLAADAMSKGGLNARFAKAWWFVPIAGAVIAGLVVLGQRMPGNATGATWASLVPRDRGSKLAFNLPRPADGLLIGVGGFTGESVRESMGAWPDGPKQRPELLDMLGPAAYARVALKPGSRVLLLGDATPLYFPTGVGYATTWDTHPLTAAVIAHPNDPGAWITALQSLGYTHLVFNGSEIARLGKGDGKAGSTWWDPRLRDEDIRAFLGALPKPLKAWPGDVALFELRAK